MYTENQALLTCLIHIHKFNSFKGLRLHENNYSYLYPLSDAIKTGY